MYGWHSGSFVPSIVPMITMGSALSGSPLQIHGRDCRILSKTISMQLIPSGDLLSSAGRCLPNVRYTPHH